MKIKLECLIPYETVISDGNSVFEIVEKNGEVVLIRNNQPAYIILKYDEFNSDSSGNFRGETSNYKLHEAMTIVLSDNKDHTMHAADLADEIFRRRLYLKKNGGKAESVQIRARCGNYKELFEPLPGNLIKLKEGAAQNGR